MEQIVRLQLLDKSPADIAAQLNISQRQLETAISSRRFREIRDRVVDRAFEKVDAVIQTRKANRILDDAAGDAAQALVELLGKRHEQTTETLEDGTVVVRQGLDAVDVRLTAVAVLDRAGFGPIQRRAVKQRVELDPALASLIGAALKESRVIDITPEVESE